MSDFYQQNYKKYHEKTFYTDSSSILRPLAQRLAPGSFILDAGCGSGRDLLWFKKQGFNVIGFERSPGLAKLARKNAGCEVTEGDFESYDFSGLSADAIVLVGALVHVPHESFQDVFENIVTALGDRGYVLVSLKEGTGEKTDAHARVFYLWEDDDLRSIFDAAGFRVAEFFRRRSAIGTDELWLTYALERARNLRPREPVPPAENAGPPRLNSRFDIS
ncbi:class I SAM-dependent methyltransferase [Desulfonema magnum]|uniref:SAM-dependent methyltransferase n=1 Tax=Desulfonema magnum TaxID=45655 RepID=A0A975BNX6_9BACT|nr:class I SAM-dependent methyltransferase [Desulfonema magnum]QTA89017.1 SAM-dependent methyltransferase [Desulfonema magnum]